MSQVTLAIIFNHKFNRNIPILFDIYKKRFSKIVFIVPFFKEGEIDGEYTIIPVYETSYSFQGYIDQAIHYLGDSESDHIIFIGDDLILHPDINETNYYEYFDLDEDTSFNVEVCKINERFENYIWNFKRISENLLRLNGDRFVTTKEEIPSINEAYDIALKKGYKDFGLVGSDYYHSVGVITKLKCLYFSKKHKKSYPAFGGYSDLTIVSSKDIKCFAHYCGVFAAMGVFVEVAIPTAMVLSCRKIKTAKDIKYIRGDLWGMDVKENFANSYEKSFKKLTENWPKAKLFIHPIKLSQWKVE